MSSCFPIRTAAVILLLFSAKIAFADEPAEPKQPPWVGAWRLAERTGVRGGGATMTGNYFGGYFAITKDTITGMNADGEVLSLLSYQLDVEQTPTAITVTRQRPAGGETREAIIGVKDGKLLICYNFDGKGRPKDFTTSTEGNDDRLMVFVPSQDPREVIQEIKAVSERKWNAFRDEDVAFLVNGSMLNERLSLIDRDGFFFDRFTFISDMAFEDGKQPITPGKNRTPKKKDPGNKIDSVKVSEQRIVVVGDTAIETGRSIATRATQKEPVWDVRYTSVWARNGKNEWQLISEQHTTVK